MPSQAVIIGSSIGAAAGVVVVLFLYYLHRRRALANSGGRDAASAKLSGQPGSIQDTRSAASSSSVVHIFSCCCCCGGDGRNSTANSNSSGGKDESERFISNNHSNNNATTPKYGSDAAAQQRKDSEENFKRSTSPRKGKGTSGGGASEPAKPKYKVKKKLGEGAYGCVYLALRHPDMKTVAVKVVPCQDEKAAEEAMKEYEMCKASQGHENIVELFDVFYDTPVEGSVSPLFGASTSSAPGGAATLADSNAAVMLKELGIRAHGAKLYLCIVSEFCEAGTLFDLLLTKRAAGQRHAVVLPEPVVWNYTAQLLRGIEHMHSKNMMHRDLKPSNCLLSDNFARLTLTDFGLSRIVMADEYAQTRTGTMQYLSPEQVQRRYNHKSDVWGVGCLLYSMCTARISNERARVMFRDRNKPTFDAEMATDLQAYSPDLLQFMLKLLAKNASERPSASEALAVCEEKLAAFARASPGLASSFGRTPPK